MSRFTPALRALSERLRLPQAARSRILLEISGDLDDLFRTCLERGLSEEEAEREAMSRVDLSEEALDDLCRVHGGWLRRVADTLARTAGPVWERALLVVLALGAVGLGGGVLQAVPMSRAAGVALVPVVAVALAGLAAGIRKAWVLMVLGDQRPARLRSGLDAVLGLSVLQIFVAFGALWVTAVGAFRSTAREPLQAGLMTMHWLQSSLALLVVSLSLAIVVGLLWFFLLINVVSIEHREAAALLGGWGEEG